jgi:hypothetical protein
MPYPLLAWLNNERRFLHSACHAKRIRSAGNRAIEAEKISGAL